MYDMCQYAVGRVDPGNPILPRSVCTDSALEVDIVIVCVEATYAVDPCSSLFTSCFTVFLTPFLPSIAPSMWIHNSKVTLICCCLFHGCLCV